jgi:multidrug transporter EmrE-like cation transporter
MAGSGSSKQNRIVMIFMAVVLVFGLVTALIEPAGEFPPQAYAIFNMALDALITLLLAVLFFAERASAPGGMKTVALLAGVVGVVAGLGQVLIRFTSDHAWWTGQYLPPVFN